MNASQNEQNIRISSPERVLRILQRVAQGGLHVLVRDVSQPETAVKGRAVSSAGVTRIGGFSIGGLSEKGRLYLTANPNAVVQVEFVLMAMKVVFQAKILRIDGNAVSVSLPDTLVSIERRKDARYPITPNAKAFIRIDNWHPDQSDQTVIPFFEYQRQNASLISAGDLSAGGLSIVSRFPAICKILQRGSIVDRGALILPLERPIPIMLEVRWVKRIRENVQDMEGNVRTARIYKFGVQFMNPSEQLVSGLQRFMTKLVVAEAI